MTVTLPTKKSKPVANFENLFVILYGRGKVGKSTFCSHIENAYFAATDPRGLDHLSVYRSDGPVETWEELLTQAKEFVDGNHNFSTFVIDTANEAYRLCIEYVTKKLGIDRPSDKNDGWSEVNMEFMRVIRKLARTKYGLYLICHQRLIPMKNAVEEYFKATPDFGPSLTEQLVGQATIVLYADVQEKSGQDKKVVKQHLLHCHPSQYFTAGDRTNRLPSSLPLNWEAFKKAWGQIQ